MLFGGRVLGRDDHHRDLLPRFAPVQIEYCPQCGGSLEIIAAIEDPAVIAKILAHLNLLARAPPRSPAQALDLFQAA